MNAMGVTPGDGESEPVRYEIVVKGHLDGRWARQFAGMTVTALPGEQTLLAGPLADQPALHGVLVRIRDLGLTLVSVAQSASKVGRVV
jgi:hypothetical protein